MRAAETLNLYKIEGYEDGLRRAVDVLDGGGVVIFPTETVYGVAARADLPQAIDRLYRIKQRDADKPFTIHVGRRQDANRYAGELSGLAKRVVKKAWPGPLTLLFSVPDPSKTEIGQAFSEDVLGMIYHAGVVGLRCPDHPHALDLLKNTNGPVAAASANRTGQSPPTRMEDALAALEGDVDLAIDGGPSQYAKASTIAKLDGDRLEIVRSGIFDERMLNGFASMTILFVCTGNTCRSPMARGIAMHMIADKLGCRPQDLPDRNIHVVSAGIAALPGAPASPDAVAVLADKNIDISDHRSEPLSVGTIQSADIVFAMTQSHLDAVTQIVPSAAERAELLAGDGDIADPIGASRDVYARCADQIENALKRRIEEIEL